MGKHYFDSKFLELFDYRYEEVIKTLQEEYEEELYELIEQLIRTSISERGFMDQLKDLIIASGEIVEETT